MPSNPQNNIIQQLSHLPTMSREQILEFFKQDLSSVEPSKIIGSLKMALLFWDPVEREELKKSILQNLNGLTRKVKELIDYLRLSTYEEMVEEIPIKVKSEKLKVKSEKLKVKSDHFDFDDAMEVDKLREKGTKFTPHSFEDKVQAVINILPSELQKELIADQLLKKRLESVISAFLKDLRDELETRQRLVAGRKSGGMGLSYDLVDQIFEVLKSGNLEKKVPSSKFQVPSFKTSDHHELVEFHEPAVPIKLEPVKFKELTSLKSQKILSTSEIEQKKKEEGIKKLRNLEIKSLAQQPMPRVAMVREAPRTQGPQFFDVKHPSNFSNPSIVSPTKEFSLLGLTDLRRGLSPRLFTEKILQKIEDLGRPDYFKRAEAIKSLRQSDLYKQYVVVGKKSLLQGQNVKDYLASVDSQSCMTYEEFEAISEMNQRLRF